MHSFTTIRRPELILTIVLLALVGLSTGAARAAAGPALSIDASAAKQHAISPYIYGMNFADEALAAELSLPVRRWGGNSTTRYSYLYDTSNHAMDWYFENIPDDNANPGALPNGSAADHFVEQDRRTGTKTLMTLPTIGWAPKSRAYACGFSIAKYGAQQDHDPYRPDCGNGKHTNGTFITGNDPTDTSTAITDQFDKNWIAHFISLYGTAATGGVLFYNLDNEPMLWNETHRDVHPLPTSYDEMRDRTYLYGAAVKQADPGAKTLGPAEWGWTGYFWSALDWAPGGSWWNSPQDRNAHGGTPFIEWYLQQMKAYEQQHGTRILDYLDLHNYPQNGVALSLAGDANTQALRLRSTRSLWDPTYNDESWISDGNPTPVMLIPRMKGWISADYPGTKIAITEYNWGGLEAINGALAQADILGIFGREGADLATIWGPPSSSQPGAYAFRMYRNYDGLGSMFGDTGVQATSGNQDQLSVYGALRGSNTLTVMVINKTGGSLTSSVSLSGFTPASTAKVYRYSSANLSAIIAQADQSLSATSFSATFPANSITLFVIPRTGGVKVDTVGSYRTSNGTFYLRSSNTAGAANIIATIQFATANELPVTGDWNGDGIDTVGVYRATTGFFYLWDANTNQSMATPVYTVLLGNPGDTPFAGHWTADMNHDGLGVYRNSNGILYMRKLLTGGFSDFSAVLGNPGDAGFAGDWDGDGFDSPGIYRPSNTQFYLSNNSTPNGITFSDVNFVFGAATDLPFAGDWIGQGHAGVGMLRSATISFYLRNVLIAGTADNTFSFGAAGDKPVAGKWVPVPKPPNPFGILNPGGTAPPENGGLD